jgi:hypothetical protein
MRTSNTTLIDIAMREAMMRVRVSDQMGRVDADPIPGGSDIDRKAEFEKLSEMLYNLDLMNRAHWVKILMSLLQNDTDENLMAARDILCARDEAEAARISRIPGVEGLIKSWIAGAELTEETPGLAGVGYLLNALALEHDCDWAWSVWGDLPVVPISEEDGYWLDVAKDEWKEAKLREWVSNIKPSSRHCWRYDLCRLQPAEGYHVLTH